MSEKYIRQNKKSCTIVKSSKTYAKIADLDDAIFIRDFLIDNDWNLDKTPQILKKEDTNGKEKERSRGRNHKNQG